MILPNRNDSRYKIPDARVVFSLAMRISSLGSWRKSRNYNKEMLTRHLAPMAVASLGSEDRKQQIRKDLLCFYCRGLRLPHHGSRLLIQSLHPRREQRTWGDYVFLSIESKLAHVESLKLNVPAVDTLEKGLRLIFVFE